MDERTQTALTALNRAIIRYRGLYARWSMAHDLGYHEMLVLYTIHESGYCTQKMISDNYLLPRQTIHNVISCMRRNDFLTVSKKDSKGREKAFVLTEKGEEYARPLLSDLLGMESDAVHAIGAKTAETIAALINTYTHALKSGMIQRDGEKNHA